MNRRTIHFTTTKEENRKETKKWIRMRDLRNIKCDVTRVTDVTLHLIKYKNDDNDDDDIGIRDTYTDDYIK